MIFDNHIHPENWGIMPYIYLGNFQMSTYSFFILLGLMVATIFYMFDIKNFGEKTKSNSYLIAISAIVCGSIGAKLPAVIELYFKFPDQVLSTYMLSSGRTILGGLIGGFIGVKVIKKVLKIEERRGNELAPSIALGMVFGRLACFTAGCCYGSPTVLPWGINFGDGIMRHPTQLYEVAFHGFMVFYLINKRKFNPEPGVQLKQYFLFYFIFRFLIEFIRINPIVFLNLSGYQVACVIFSIGLLFKMKGQVFYGRAR